MADARERQAAALAAVDRLIEIARAATPGPWWHDPGKQWLGPDAFVAYDRSEGEEFVGYGESPFSGCVAATGPASHAQSMNDAAHIAANDPITTIAQLQGRHHIIERHAPEPWGSGQGDPPDDHSGWLCMNMCGEFPCPDWLDATAGLAPSDLPASPNPGSNTGGADD